jgi:hypothetical protein
LAKGKRNIDPGVLLKVDDLLDVMMTREHHKFNWKSYGVDGLVEWDQVSIKKNEFGEDEDDRIDEYSKGLLYILLQLFVKDHQIEEKVDMTEAEAMDNEKIAKLVYQDGPFKVFPRYYAPYLSVQSASTDFLAASGVTVESVLLTWVNDIIKKQVREYEQYVVVGNQKGQKFDRISTRVTESISSN